MSAEEEATLQERLRQAERQLAANKTRIRNLSGKVHVLEASLNGQPLPMTKRLVLGLLHPDNALQGATRSTARQPQAQGGRT